MPHQHSLLREGIIAGILGGLAVAVWFLIIDAIAGRPMFTPSILGGMVMSIFQFEAREEVFLPYVAIYTVLHFAAWAALGIFITFVIHQSDRQPTILALALMVFVIVTIAFLGITAILAEFTPLGSLAWYNVLIGNALAVLAMLTYLWRTHPVLGRTFGRGLSGR